MRISAQYPDEVYFDQDEKTVFLHLLWGGEVKISAYFYSNDLLRILFLTGLAVAGVSDWKYYRIPNWVIVWEMALGCISLFFQAVRGKIGIWNVQWLWFLVAVAACVFRAVLLLIPGIVLSHFGLVGAGDMKLMAVFAVWLGLEKTGKVFIAGLLLGAVLSLLKMLQDGSAWERFLYLSAYIRQVFNDKKVEKYYVLSRDGTGCVIPLGACFCAGDILILVL